MARDREQFPVATAQHVPIAFDVAGLGDRFVATLIDYAILGACLSGWGLGVVGLREGAGLHDPWAISLFIVGLIPALVYFPICELVFDGQTIGKWARSLRVMRMDGAAPTLGDLLLRWLLRPLDLWVTSGLAAVLTVLYTGTGQRLGDLAAGTTVVEQRTRSSLDDTLFTDLPDDYAPTFPEARDLDHDDIETVRRVLRRLSRAADERERADENVRTLAAQARQALLRRMDTTTALDPTAFFKTLLRDYNYYQRR